MAEKLLDQIKVFEVYYSIGITRSITKLLEELHRQHKSGIPSEGTLKKWSARYKWQNKIVIRDNATYEGVAEKMTEAAVDVKMLEIAQVDKEYKKLDTSDTLILDAQQSTLYTDEKTGKRRCSIVPGNTREMVLLYKAQTDNTNAKIKLIEIKIKLLGIPDTHVVTLERRVLSDDPDIMAAENDLLKLIAMKESNA